MFKYTKTTLKKLENVFEEVGYKVRYEKGSFQSGYCVVENRKIAVVNKFFDVEGRINVLLEILSVIEDFDEKEMTEKTLDFYHKILKMTQRENGNPSEEKLKAEEDVVVAEEEQEELPKE